MAQITKNEPLFKVEVFEDLYDYIMIVQYKGKFVKTEIMKKSENFPESTVINEIRSSVRMISSAVKNDCTLAETIINRMGCNKK